MDQMEVERIEGFDSVTYRIKRYLGANCDATLEGEILTGRKHVTTRYSMRQVGHSISSGTLSDLILCLQVLSMKVEQEATEVIAARRKAKAELKTKPSLTTLDMSAPELGPLDDSLSRCSTAIPSGRNEPALAIAPVCPEVANSPLLAGIVVASQVVPLELDDENPAIAR